MNTFNLVPWKGKDFYYCGLGNAHDNHSSFPDKNFLLSGSTSSCLHLKCSLFIYTFVLKFVEIPLSHFQFADCLEETKHSNIYKLPSNGTCHVCNHLVLISNLVRLWNTSLIPFWHEYSDSCSMLCFGLVLKDNKLSLHKTVPHCPTVPLHCHFNVQLLDLCF